MSPRSYVSMGPEPVRLARSESDPSIAFARTGKVFCRVHHRRPNSSVATIDSILFTDTENGEHSCASVPAFSQIPGCEAGSAHVLSGYIFAVSEDNLIIARLDDDIRGGSGPLRKSTLAPRRRLLEGTPSRLIPVGTQRLAVASMGTKQVRQPPNAYRTEPTGIELVEWGGSKTGQEGVVTSPSMAAVTASFRMQDYERALTMIYPKDFLRTKADPAFPYRFFIVGTSARNKDGKEYGRKLFFKIQGNSLVLEKAKVCESPVRSMAAFTTSMLLSLCGPVLTLEGFHYGEKRYVHISRIRRYSSGIN